MNEQGVDRELARLAAMTERAQKALEGACTAGDPQQIADAVAQFGRIERTAQGWPSRGPAGMAGCWRGGLLVASLAADVAVTEPTGTGRVIAAWPSFALIASYELLMRRAGTAGLGRPLSCALSGGGGLTDATMFGAPLCALCPGVLGGMSQGEPGIRATGRRDHAACPVGWYRCQIISLIAMTAPSGQARGDGAQILNGRLA